MYETIIDSAAGLTQANGLHGWNLDMVARSAGCAKGLVNYHFGSKDTLLALVRERLEFQRREARIGALAGAAGTEALDRLWRVLEEEVAAGGFGAWLDLTRHFGPSTEGAAAADDDRLAHGAARALGIAEGELADDATVLGPALDGLQLRLLQGASPSRVREGFERLWWGVLG